jgi:predicted transcriptional regulator
MSIKPEKSMLWDQRTHIVPEKDLSFPDVISTGCWISGIPVTAHLHSFASAFLKSTTGYKVGMTDVRVQRHKLYSEKPFEYLYVYREDSVYVCGIIGYGDMSAGVKGKNKYYVMSNHIENQHVDYTKNAYKTKSSANMETALKAARSNLQPMSLAIIHDRERHEFKSAFNSKFSKLSNAATKAREDLVGKVFDRTDSVSTFENILLHNVKDAELLSMCEDANIKLAEFRKIKSETYPLSMVTVTEHNGKALCKVQEIYEKESWSSNPYFEMLHESKTKPYLQYYEDELPTELAEKLATLNVLGNRGYVLGLGCKLFDNLFYVHTTMRDGVWK